MYLKVDSDLIKKIEKITMTDYDCAYDLVPSESIVPMLQDLLIEIDRLEEKYKDLQQEISDNYELKKVNLYSEYGVNERDFY